MTEPTAIQPETSLAVKSEDRDLDNKGIALATLDDVRHFAAAIMSSSFCPDAYRGKPKDALVAILAGRAVGLTPIQSLNGIAVVRGKPSMWGDARAAVVLAGCQVEYVREWFELDGKTVNPSGMYPALNEFPEGLTACWSSKRKDASEPTPVVRFSVGDAKLAGLWGKAGTWSSYPLRMLHMRARAFGERDYYADALHGIGQLEEEMEVDHHERDPLHDIVDAEEVTLAAVDDESE